MKFVGQLLARHLARYPRMQLDDVYKLLHQAAMGSEHVLHDPAAALHRLEDEAAALGDGPEEPAEDIISPDGRLARIHLRTYLRAGGRLDDLHRAFVETANHYPASPDKLAKFCGCLGEFAETGALAFPPAEVVAWFDDIARRGYPVVHHSTGYREAYRPAYRVVDIGRLAR